MKETIADMCRELERENSVRILFAVENGSRAWRMNSADSDYDIRFVYARPLPEYLRINRQEEVLNRSFDKDLHPCEAKGAFIDVSGFDVFKYARLLSASNPTAIEWLVSDIVYYGEQNTAFRKFATKEFNPISLYHHYKSMCRENYLKGIKNGADVTHKRYLYAYRGLVNALWVESKETVPPIIFTEALEGLGSAVPPEVRSTILEIVRMKSEGREKDSISPIEALDEHIEAFLAGDGIDIKGKPKPDTASLDRELERILLSN